MSQTLCFFGSTGGVTNACLTLALKSGSYKVIALVRTPDKLRTQLITKQGLDESTIDKKLTIVQGNAIELADVKRTLLANISSGVDKTLPSMIMTGLGGAPKLQFDIFHPLQIANIDNPTICGTAAKTLITALKELYAERPNLAAAKPSVAFVSTTGISRGAEDVPFSMRFLYHQMLTIPHADKRNMENALRDQMLETTPVFADVTGIRPTLLLGTGALSEGTGFEKIRAGAESEPAQGFTIQRADVGAWTFENVIKQAGDRRWRGEMISLAA